MCIFNLIYITHLIRTLSMVPSVSVLTGFDCICTFCETEVENIIHSFWSCNVPPSSFWRDFKGWIIYNLDNTTTLEKINLDTAIALGLRPSIFHKQMYFYFLLARKFIWIGKTQGKAPKLENCLCFSTLFL